MNEPPVVYVVGKNYEELIGVYSDADLARAARRRANDTARSWVWAMVVNDPNADPPVPTVWFFEIRLEHGDYDARGYRTREIDPHPPEYLDGWGFQAVRCHVLATTEADAIRQAEVVLRGALPVWKRGENRSRSDETRQMAIPADIQWTIRGLVPLIDD